MKNSVFLFIPAIFFFGNAVQAQKLQASDDKALFQVQVINAQNEPRGGEQILFLAASGGQPISGVSDALGKFEVLLPEGETYRIQIKSIGSDKKYGQFEVPRAEGEQLGELSVQIDFSETVFTLEGVQFNTNEATLLRPSFTVLNDLFEIMQRKPTLVIELAGHTDNTGTEETNQKLSSARAKTVRGYLIKKGIEPARIVAVGYGASQPVADNRTAAGRQLNRRTEVRITAE